VDQSEVANTDDHRQHAARTASHYTTKVPTADRVSLREIDAWVASFRHDLMVSDAGFASASNAMGRGAGTGVRR
jgi:hypothetical protein